jgi:hypothetical protein
MSKLPDQNCSQCPNSNKCSEVYEKLGKSDCKPITRHVSIAFLLPMVVFIATIALFERFCGDYFSSKTVCSLVSLLCGLGAAIASVFLARLVRSKDENH